MVRISTCWLLLSVFAVVASATVYFSEDFSGDWQKRWVESYPKKAEGAQGTWGVSAGKYFGNEEAEKGLKTMDDARFYDISAKFPEFSNKGKKLILQYSVKHEQNIDCGGGYIKVLPAGIDQANFNADTKYNIMFGPDICGSTKRVHVIFSHNGENYLIKKHINCESDTATHLYTLHVNPDNTYEVFIDQKSVAKGSLTEDWDILPPKKIPDPAAKKPADWVDQKEIVDPEDKKPEGWDDIPAQIKDPEATKPEDWDDELDGEWEAPLIDNPEYKGEWHPKMIPNPDYKGEWIHPQIDNPDYKDDPELYAYDSNSFVAFELWQVKAGTIFDNILLTDDVDTAEEWAKKTVAAQEGEKKAKEEEEKAEKKKAEEDDDEDADEDDDDEDEHDDHDGHDHGHAHADKTEL
jgi:calreticulin